MNRTLASRLRDNLHLFVTGGSAMALFAVWWTVTERGFFPPFVLPKPAAVLHILLHGSSIGVAKVNYVPNVWLTVQATLLGFGIGTLVGVLLGALLFEMPALDEALYPYLAAIQSLPKLALVPLLLVWLGVGQPPKIATSALVAFFPVLINTMTGLRSVEPELLELMHSFNASRWRTLTAVQFPSALPLVFTGMEMAIAYALVGVMLAEFLAADSGAGLIIREGQNSMSTAEVFAMLVVLSLLGLAFQWVIRSARTRVVFWVERIQLAVT